MERDSRQGGEPRRGRHDAVLSGAHAAGRGRSEGNRQSGPKRQRDRGQDLPVSSKGEGEQGVHTTDGLAGPIPTMGRPRKKVFLFFFFSKSFSFPKFFSWRDEHIV